MHEKSACVYKAGHCWAVVILPNNFLLSACCHHQNLVGLLTDTLQAKRYWCFFATWFRDRICSWWGLLPPSYPHAMEKLEVEAMENKCFKEHACSWVGTGYDSLQTCTLPHGTSQRELCASAATLVVGTLGALGITNIINISFLGGGVFKPLVQASVLFRGVLGDAVLFRLGYIFVPSLGDARAQFRVIQEDWFRWAVGALVELSWS